MSDEAIIKEILEGDLQTLYNMIEMIKDENQELQETYEKAKHGIRIKYNINYNLKGLAQIRDREKRVIVDGKTYPLEEWWDEEENRKSLLRNTLYEYHTDTKPYRGRQ